jgi:hypothetical protein
MPFCSRKPLISRIEPMAMKMSSPKNSAILSAPAAWRGWSALGRQFAQVGSFSAAPSAIGAISGTHHLRMPAQRGQAQCGRQLAAGSK